MASDSGDEHNEDIFGPPINVNEEVEDDESEIDKTPIKRQVAINLRHVKQLGANRKAGNSTIELEETETQEIEPLVKTQREEYDETDFRVRNL